MKAIILISLSLLTFSRAEALEIELSCRFQGEEDWVTSEACATQSIDGNIRIDPKMLKNIKFEKGGIAGGYFGNLGCFWLNKKGIIRKTHCYDNGADYFKEGLARYINHEAKFGYMDKKLNVKIAPAYDFAFPFENGLAKVCISCKSEMPPGSEHSILKGGTWKVINKAGKVLKSCPKANLFQDCNL